MFADLMQEVRTTRKEMATTREVLMKEMVDVRDELKSLKENMGKQHNLKNM